MKQIRITSFLCCASLIFIIMPVVAQEVYHNPVDGNDYTGNWQTYNARPDKPQPAGRVQNAGVVLLTNQQAIAASITVKALGDYIISIGSILTQDIQNRPDSGQVIIQVELKINERPQIQMSHKGNLSDAFLQTAYDHLQGASYPSVTGSDVVFQVMYSIAGA